VIDELNKEKDRDDNNRRFDLSLFLSLPKLMKSN